MINLEVVLRHARGGKPFLEPPADSAAIKRESLSDLADGFLDATDDIAGDTVVDHLRHGAAPKRQDRSATSHGLDHGEAKRLRPIDRKEQCPRLALELAFP